MQLIADAQAPAEFIGNSMMVVCLVCGTILNLVVTAVGVWIAARRSPPIGEEMHRDFATAGDVDDNIQRIHGRIDDLSDTINLNQRDSDKARGRLEGKVDMLCQRWGIHPPSHNEDQ